VNILTENFSIIIPFHKSKDSFPQTLESISSQDVSAESIIIIVNPELQNEKTIHEFLIFNIQKFKKLLPFTKFTLVKHKFNYGLFQSYKTALAISNNDVNIFMHSDTVLTSTGELSKLFVELRDEDVVAVGHINKPIPIEFTKVFNWQLAALLAPTLYKKARGWNGSFDLIKKSTFDKCDMSEFESLYDAGEDGMLVSQLSQFGKVVISDASSYNFNGRHNINSSTLIQKRIQYSEAHGILLRKGRVKLIELPGILWRQLSFLFLLFSITISFVLDNYFLILLSFIPFSIIPIVISSKWKFIKDFHKAFVLEILSSGFALYGLIKGFITRNSTPKKLRKLSEIKFEVIFTTN
jgi:glycosyltransferase involved in cell wall biosynthesis